KGRSKGAVVYECLLCPSDQAWSNPKRDNAVYHAKRKHGDIINSSECTTHERSSDIGPPLKQARLGDYYTANPSELALRRVFNPQRYTENMVALLTRRRLPFSAVLWDEMQDIMLACNPAIEDLIMTSRHEAMRHITTDFTLYQSQLIFSTLVFYGITKQLGCHTGNNATSNDTCAAFINWDPKHHRIRCILHIINLSLQAFLFAASQEALKAALDAASDVTGSVVFK
ncbi:hypothetical protein DM02DRAFT_505269, partial [Periconia macrospinosa]